VQHFLSNERDRERTLKRGGGQRPISLDGEAAEGRYRIEPADDLTPEKVFERRWATTMLERAMQRLQAELADRSGGGLRFDRLKVYLTGEEPAPAYPEVAEELGMTESAVAVAVHRMRRRFGELLREEVAETVADAREIDGEVRYLLEALGGESADLRP
jgi:RNA polymerase sigma-70 factor (ECF subfamily)